MELDDLIEILSINEKVPENKKLFHVRPSGKIEFKKVSFKYPHWLYIERRFLCRRKRRKASNRKKRFRNKLGASGSGKSTIIKLILKYFDVDEGGVYVDDLPLTSVSTKTLTKHIGLLPQDCSVFNSTILHNITYGDIGSTFPQAKKAAELAEAHNFIVELEDGYDTVLEPRGMNISGGERRRICIARCLLKSCHILLLDEATTHLDGDTANKIISALFEKNKDKTILFVSHRIWVSQLCDRVIFIDNGQVQAVGRFTFSC